MLEQFKRLGRHSVAYGLSNALAASMSLLLLPILTRYLPPAEYGALDLALVFAAQLGIVLQLGLGSAVFKFVLQGSTGSAQRSQILATAYYTIAGFALVVCGALVAFAGPLAHALLGDANYSTAITCVLVKAFAEAVAVVPMTRLRIREESIKYGALNVGRIAFSLLVFSTVLIVFRAGFRGVMLAVAAESLVFAATVSATAFSDLRTRFSVNALKGMLAFGLPLVPLAFGLTALSVGDRYVLRQFTDLDEVGRYAVANKLAAGLNIVIRAFQVAWPAVLFSASDRPDAGRFYSRMLTYLVFVLSAAGLAVSVFARDMVGLLAGASYGPAYTVVPILTLAQIAFGLFYATAVGSNLTGKSHFQTIAVAVALAVFVGLCYILIPRYGMIGAALASASGYATLASVSCLLSLRVYPIQYEWGRIAVLLVVAAGLSAFGYMVTTPSLVLDIVIKIGVVGLYPLLLYAFGFLNPSERKLLHHFPSALVKGGVVSQEAGSP